MPACIANYMPTDISDHSPIKVELLNAPRRISKPFKYCNIWATHPKFLKVVTTWQNVESGCAMLQVVKKLKSLKRNLKELNKQHFRNILTEAEDDRTKLEQIQKALQANPRDQNVQVQEKEQYQKFKRSSYLAEGFLQQSSKAAWIQLGDDNSKYFFSVIKHRRLK